MLEIKFKLLLNGVPVGYEKWNAGKWNQTTGEWDLYPGWFYSIDDEKWYKTFIPHNTKRQFIGLKDKNGTEIYEGDVANVTMRENHDEYKDYKMQVVWNDEKAGFFFKDGEGEWTVTHTPVEVIGNIHENPELLEKL